MVLRPWRLPEAPFGKSNPAWMIPGSRLFTALRPAAGGWNGLWSAPTHGALSTRGSSDLAVEIDGKWNLVDFKTSRPLEGESVEDFLEREVEAHAPQLQGYREICAKLTGKEQSQVDAFIYWTALRKNRRTPA